MTAGAGQPPRQAPAAGRRKQVARTVMLAWAARLPWDSRFQQRLIMLAIAVGALRGLARDGQARAAAWDQRQRQRSLGAEAKRALKREVEKVRGQDKPAPG